MHSEGPSQVGESLPALLAPAISSSHPLGALRGSRHCSACSPLRWAACCPLFACVEFLTPSAAGDDYTRKKGAFESLVVSKLNSSLICVRVIRDDQDRLLGTVMEGSHLSPSHRERTHRNAIPP